MAVELQNAGLKLVQWAINTGAIAKMISIPNVTAQGLSFGPWEISVRRIE